MCEIEKKTAEWKFLNLEISIFFNFSKIYSAEFFLIFLVSSSVCNKKIFIKKICSLRTGSHQGRKKIRRAKWESECRDSASEASGTRGSL